MKHLVLVPLYPPVRYGGIEIIAERLCGAMAATDEVTALALNPQLSSLGHRKFGSVEVWEVPGHFFSPLAADAANSAVLEVARRVARDADVVHCHDWFLASAACTIAARGLPLVGYFHTVKALERHYAGDKQTSARRYSEEKQTLLARTADVVAVYSDFMVASVHNCFGIPTQDIVRFACGPTLPLNRRSPPCARPGDGLRVTYIGRLAPEKGVDHLLDAFLEVYRDRPWNLLRVLGSGPMAHDLIRHASQHPSTGIEFVPFTADPVALMEEYLLSDLVVVPSRFEPYGLVAAEALTLGVPVAVAAVGGLPEVVGWGKFGDVFAADGTKELVEILAALASRTSEYRERAASGRRAHSDPGRWQDAVARVLAGVPGVAQAAVY